MGVMSPRVIGVMENGMTKKSELRLMMEALEMGGGLTFETAPGRTIENAKSIARAVWNSSLGAYRFAVTQNGDQILIRRVE
jgi:hypothetical protein